MSTTAAALRAARALYGRPDPDADLERRINAACRLMQAHLATGDLAKARAAQARMRELIGQRSPGRVMDMERERGLR